MAPRSKGQAQGSGTRARYWDQEQAPGSFRDVPRGHTPAPGLLLSITRDSSDYC